MSVPASIARAWLLLVRREEVDDAVDGLGGVDGVDRREHEVAGLGGGQRRAHGLLVAHLADQDHVRVLAQDAPQGALERRGVDPDLALVDDRRASRCRNSIGSSIVTMCRDLVALMWSIIAASVVDLPEPVVPVSRISPRSSSARSRDHRRQPELVDRADMLNGITRATIETEPRWRNALTRKRARSGTA